MWSEVLGVERVGAQDNFFDLGGDSILSMQVVSRARAAGVPLHSRDVFQRQTVAALAAVESEAPRARPGRRSRPSARCPPPRCSTGSSPPRRNDPPTSTSTWSSTSTPVPTGRRWPPPSPRCPRGTTRCAPEPSASGDGGSSTPNPSARGHRPDCAPSTCPGRPPPGRTPPSGRGRTARRPGSAWTSLSQVRRGPLRAGAERGPALLLTAHHLVVDGVSWRILTEDLETAYHQAAEGRAVDLGAPTTSFRAWALRLEEHTAKGGFDAEAGYWEKAAAPGPALPRDGEGPRRAGAARSVTVELSAEETGTLLRRASAAYHTGVETLLAAACGRALARWTGQRRTLVAMEGHGREELFEDVDLNRTVGWFTSLYPVALSVGPEDGWDVTLPSVKEQLRAVPGRGVGFGALRYLSGSPSAGLTTGRRRGCPR
ncbi:condensation domain-containing protein [Streptomyces albus]|nr:condensation domain-containing protein [Streptomyces albus]